MESVCSSVVEKCCEGVLWRSVGGEVVVAKCCREVCDRSVVRSVVEKSCAEVLLEVL